MLAFDFEKAKSLYLELGTDFSKKIAVQIFEQKNVGRAFVEDFLKKEWAKLLEDSEKKSTNFPKKTTPKYESVEINKIDRTWRDSYAEAARLHERLKMLSEGEWDEAKGYEYAFEILEKFKVIYHSWDVIDHYKRTNSVAGSEIPEMDELSASRRLQSIRTLLSPKRRAVLEKEKIESLEKEKRNLENYLKNGTI